MDKIVAEHILKWHHESDLDFIKLLNFITENDLPIINSRLIKGLGIATYYSIHLDINRIETIPYRLRYFIILHEIAHYKRLYKKGLDYHLSRLSSKNVQDVYEHILLEELIADKYGMVMYYVLTKSYYPYEETQRINENKFKFMDSVNDLISGLENNEDSYKTMINNHIIL
jgi:hypothetical protein